MSDFIAEFGAAMADAGVVSKDVIVADSKIHRIPVEGDRRGKRNGWYILFNDSKPAGAFGSMKTGQKHTWSARGTAPLTAEERRAIAEKAKADRIAREAAEAAMHRAAAVRAAAMWDTAQPATDHPYLTRKKIKPYGARVAEWVKEWCDPETGEVHETRVPDALLVPIRNSKREIVSIQAIFADDKNPLGRNKDFLPGGEKRGCFFTIGAPTDPIILTEGFATGASIHEATGYGIVVCFDAGNLLPVAREVRRLMPDATILIAADDDRKTKGNPGITNAKMAAEAVGGLWVAPFFADPNPQLTDFNDLAIAEGAAEVQAQILAALHQCALVDGALQMTSPKPLSSESKTTEEAIEIERSPKGSDDALALAMASDYANELRFIPAWGQWFVYGGGVWRQDDILQAWRRAKRICRRAAAECEDKAAHATKKLTSANTVAAVERMARSDRRLVATVDQWDADPWALNTPGGVVDLRTGDLRSHRITDYSTKITAVAPGGNCPRFCEFLHQITDGDRDLQEFLARMFGYALTGVTREHALFFCYGKGGNGKSVLIETVSNILARYAQVAGIETFTASNFDRHPTELAGLRGARLVTATETEEGRQWAEARIKALTGGDKITARFMRQDFFEFQPQFKLVIAGNHLPGLRAVDDAIRRRFHLVPFNVTIPREKRDLQLSEKLKQEWSGILQWMIGGCLDWQAQGLKPPAAVTNATSNYLDTEDALANWISERCLTKDPDAWAASSALFMDWQEWAKRAGEPARTQKRLSNDLEGRGFRPHRRSTGRGFNGLQLIPQMTGWTAQ